MQKQQETIKQNNQPELPETDVVLDSYGTTSLPVPDAAPVTPPEDEGVPALIIQYEYV